MDQVVSLSNHDWAELGESVPISTATESAPERDLFAIAEHYRVTPLFLQEACFGRGVSLILPNLYLGTCGDAAYLPLLKRLQITRVLNVAAEADGPPHPEFVKDYLWLKWRDSEEQATLLRERGTFGTLQRAIDFIQSGVDGGGVVFVHCMQGVSRSAAVVAAFLVQHQKISMDAAVALVRQQRPCALNPFRFQELIRAYMYFLKYDRKLDYVL
jgi:predicted protein tyrosine phosphatase